MTICTSKFLYTSVNQPGNNNDKDDDDDDDDINNGQK